MKNTLQIFAFILITILINACSTPSQDRGLALVMGDYTGDAAGKEIHLSKVEHGEKTVVATTQISAGGQFAFAYPVEKAGVHVVNVVYKEAKRNVARDHDLLRLYLESGTEIKVELTDGEYDLLESNCKKNELLSAWNNQVDTVYTHSHGFGYSISDYEGFFPILPEFVSQAETFLSSINTKDKQFNELMNLLVETDLNYAALQFLYTPRTKHPQRDVYPEYYDYILNSGSPESERLLELPMGYNYIHLYSMYASVSAPKSEENKNRLLSSVHVISSDLLKGYYASKAIKRFSAYNDEYKSFKQQVESFLETDYLKEQVKQHEISIRKIAPGEPAIDFSGADTNGKIHKLSDYKGTVVYVDVWATWCGPCKKQIPYLKELEKKYHGKPITFLSISLDKKKDHAKWKDFVKNEELKGVQIIADKAFDSDVAKAYQITGIPTFMIFDKEGNIVSTKAPRPSGDNIEEVLDELL